MASAAFHMTSGHDFVAGTVLPKHVSIFVEVSQKTLVLEVRSFSFRGSLAQNARFGSPDLQFWWKSRIRRFFWSSGFAVFEEVSYKMLNFGAPDFQFSRKSHRKRSFWKSGSSVFGELSYKTLILELRIFSFRGSLA